MISFTSFHKGYDFKSCVSPYHNITHTKNPRNDEPCWKKAWYPKREEDGERFGYITLRQRWLMAGGFFIVPPKKNKQLVL
jgi:hypothetical protein